MGNFSCLGINCWVALIKALLKLPKERIFLAIDDMWISTPEQELLYGVMNCFKNTFYKEQVLHNLNKC